MRAPQVVIYERDSRLTGVLRELITARKWTLREARSPDSCLRALHAGGPAVVVLRIGKDVSRNLGLLERCSWLHPDCPAVVVGDGDSALFASLAWDLGARFVLPVAQAREQLPGVVGGLMDAAAQPPAPDARRRPKVSPEPKCTVTPPAEGETPKHG